MALVSIAVLLALLGALVLSRQYLVPADPSRPTEPAEAPPVTAGPATQAPPAAAPGGSTSAEGTESPPSAPDTTPLRLSLPLAGTVAVVKPYESIDQAYGDFRHYHGIAYATAPGHSVLAAAEGVVEWIENDPADGLTLTVRHSDSLRTRYAGLGKVLVKEGQRVEAGSVIAQTGAPSLARAEMGPHLAFQVWRDGEPIDPTILLH